MRKRLGIAVLVLVLSPCVARAQRGNDVARVSAQVVGGVTAGTIGGLFGAAGGQALAEVLPGGPTFWTFVGTVSVHNAATIWGAAVASRLVEGRSVRYSEARKGAIIGDGALFVYAAVVSPLLSRVGCDVGSWCGKTFGVAAHLLPAVGASIAIERAR